MTSTLPPLVQAVSGSVGSAIANAVSYPLDLVCTRLQISEKKEKQGKCALQWRLTTNVLWAEDNSLGISEAVETLQRIISTRGTAGLYDGLPADTSATLLSRRVALIGR